MKTKLSIYKKINLAKLAITANAAELYACSGRGSDLLEVETRLQPITYLFVFC